MSSDEAYFTKQFEAGFGEYDPADEDQHPEYRESKPHHALTETQYFSFGVPEHNVHGTCYLWYHPNLQVVSAGPIVFQGRKDMSLAAELFDYRNYIPAAQLGGKLTDFELENSYAVKRVGSDGFRISYDDPSRDNRFEVELTPACPPRMWPGNKHLDQLMHTRGELTLRGITYAVGGYGFRNRSWGELRLEDPMALPPISRLTGAFSDELMFTVLAYEDPAMDPVWKDRVAFDPQKTLKFGWLLKDGELAAIKTVRTLTKYDEASLLPRAVDLEIVDIRDRHFKASGSVMAVTPLNTWPNIRTVMGQLSWSGQDGSGWGELINAQGNDFLNKLYSEGARA